MTIKSAQSLVQAALDVINTIDKDEAFKLYDGQKCNLIDIRDVRELERDGKDLNNLSQETKNTISEINSLLNKHIYIYSYLM